MSGTMEKVTNVEGGGDIQVTNVEGQEDPTISVTMQHDHVV